MVFATGMTDAVLQEHFGWLFYKAVMVDGLGAYQRLFRDLQSYCMHLLVRMRKRQCTAATTTRPSTRCSLRFTVAYAT